MPSTPPPAYSPPKSEEPRIAIIYKGKPQLPKKATETDEDQAHEALILRTLKQIEDADLAGIFLIASFFLSFIFPSSFSLFSICYLLFFKKMMNLWLRWMMKTMIS